MNIINLDKSVKCCMIMGNEYVHNVHVRCTIKVNIFEIQIINNVLFFPGLNSNLFPMDQFLKESYLFIFRDSKCTIYREKIRKNYFLKFQWQKLNKVFHVHVAIKVVLDDDWLWHFGA